MGNVHGPSVKCSWETHGCLSWVRGLPVELCHCRQSPAALRAGLPEPRNHAGARLDKSGGGMGRGGAMKAAEPGWGPLGPHPPGLPGDAWHPEIGIFGALEAGGSHFLKNTIATASTGSLLPFSMPVTCPSFSQSVSQSTNITGFLLHTRS